jgi:hypothetical protein
MVVGLLLMLSVRAFTAVAWPWYVLIGSTTTFAAGWAASLFLIAECGMRSADLKTTSLSHPQSAIGGGKNGGRN